MKIWKLIVGILLFITPISIHNADIALESTSYMMTPIGGIMIRGDTTTIAFHSFSWYTEDGRVDYVFDKAFDFVLDAGDGNSQWMIGVEGMDVILTAEALLTIITLYALALYLILSFFNNKTLSFIADVLLLGCAVMALVAYVLFIDNSWASFDLNIPISPIIMFIAAIFGLVQTAKSK
ncbi:MAG: hypothetical protein ACTSVO_07935 [Candidatus Heimdallarchaeaceae archaeon]